MIVQKQNVRRDNVSCNFCSKGKLSTSGIHLVYPYEYVYVFSREGNGLTACICEECGSELSEKLKTFNPPSTGEQK